MFIFAKQFHCIDVSPDETGDEVENESNTTNTITESPTPDQTTNAGNFQPQENNDAMQMCNQSFPTPKGTVLCVYE